MASVKPLGSPVVDTIKTHSRYVWNRQRLDEKILLKTTKNINSFKTKNSNELFAMPEFITRQRSPKREKFSALCSHYIAHFKIIYVLPDVFLIIPGKPVHSQHRSWVEKKRKVESMNKSSEAKWQPANEPSLRCYGGGGGGLTSSQWPVRACGTPVPSKMSHFVLTSYLDLSRAISCWTWANPRF